MTPLIPLRTPPQEIQQGGKGSTYQNTNLLPLDTQPDHLPPLEPASQQDLLVNLVTARGDRPPFLLVLKRYSVVEEGGGGLDFEVDLDGGTWGRGREGGWVWGWGWGCGVWVWEVDVRGFDGGASLGGGGGRGGWFEVIAVGLGGGEGGVRGGGGFHLLVFGWVG